ncbi:MAG: pilus assembly protein TadG-related protein [Actinomycetota bacterium]
MRMMRLLRDDERGATIALVAICLMAFMGMVVLVVDVGGLLTLRRRLVTAADSAALAAAQSCAKMNAVEAPGQADDLATANVSDAVRDLYTHENCGTESSGEVTARYHSIRTLTFAPVIGGPAERQVAAQASAIWGPAGGASPVPIEFSVTPAGVLPCSNQEVGTECAYWHDNSTDFGLNDSSSWGFMNLAAWGVDPDASCPNSGSSDRADWIDGSERTNSKIESRPTFVCIDSGHSSSSWYEALRNQMGKIKFFPINDPDQMIRTAGKEKYAVIGFTALRVDLVLKGNDVEAVGSPGGSGRCTAKHSFTPNEALNLDLLGCYSTTLDSITNLQLSKTSGRSTTVYQPGVDYTYDDQTHMVTWTTNAVQDVAIEFDWTAAGSPGKCGIRKPDPNAVCLVVSWQGIQVGGSLPGADNPDFGLRAVRLSG